MIRFLFFVFSFLIINTNCFSQSGWGVGGGGLYNTRNGYVGVSARVLIPITKKLYAVPYGYYYFHEGKVLGGVAALVPFYEYNIFNFYALASGTIKGSASARASGNGSVDNTATNGSGSVSGSASLKADGEAGFGTFIGRNCLKGYIEPRYGVLNKEFLIHAGIVYFFNGCGSGSGKGFNKGRKIKTFKSNDRGKQHCPAYN